jgi:hypothetical protein
MVSPQLLLGLGLALPLVAIGGYVAWLGQRVTELEERVEEDAGPATRDE